MGKASQYVASYVFIPEPRWPTHAFNQEGLMKIAILGLFCHCPDGLLEVVWPW